MEVGKKKKGAPLDDAAMELLTPELGLARSDALSYLADMRQRCSAGSLFDLPLHNAGESGLVIELEKYGPTVTFLRNILDRNGFEIVPRGAQKPRTEMEALMNWLFDNGADEQSPYRHLAQQHPEFRMMRDMAALFKFLTSMLSMQQERMLIAASAEVRHYHLSFDGSGGGNRLHKHRRMTALHWNLVRVRGGHQHIADLTVFGYGEEEM